MEKKKKEKKIWKPISTNPHNAFVPCGQQQINKRVKKESN